MFLRSSIASTIQETLHAKCLVPPLGREGAYARPPNREDKVDTSFGRADALHNRKIGSRK
jgi:hypothetical protein